MSKHITKEKIKKGGPYTKKEQEERKIQVYHLHFEENKSAVKIAELLNVNRNTINDDIRSWYLQFTNEIKTQDLTAKMTKQIQRIEIQRDRLLDSLECTESLDEKLSLEKFISEIDNRLIQLYSKMILSGKTRLESTVELQEINEDEIKEFVRDLILRDENPDSEYIYSEDDLKFDFIRRTKCDVEYTVAVIKKMNRDGMVLCEIPREMNFDDPSSFTHYYSRKYNLGRFANMRGYLTVNEFDSIIEKRDKIKQEIESN